MSERFVPKGDPLCVDVLGVWGWEYYQKFVNTECFKTPGLLAGKSEAEINRYKTDLAVYGLAGESGEVIDVLKKEFFHGAPRNREAEVKEAGDLMWYFALFLASRGITMTEVLKANMEKLVKRHAEGYFDKAHA